MTDIIDVYHPLVQSDHEGECAALCTDNAAGPGPCMWKHRCWCPDGSLSYAEFNAKHPDVTVAEA